MSKIFVPIDSSNLSELIPEGDDVIYSGYCNVRIVAGKAKIKWKSHVLATKSGFAAFTNIAPSKDKGKYIRYKERKKKEGMIAQFIPWEEFGTDINMPPFSKNAASYTLNRDASKFKRIYVVHKDPNYKGFGHFCRDLWLDIVMK
jgi:hypothetical protein